MERVRRVVLMAVLAWFIGGIPPVIAQSRDGLDRRVMLVNNTAHFVTEFYASRINVPTWQEDMLGARVLSPWSTTVMHIDDGSGYCMYDLKAVFSDGTDVQHRRVNVCAAFSWVISEPD